MTSCQTRSRTTPALLRRLAVAVGALALLALPCPALAGGTGNTAAALYLDQAGAILADARANIDSLQFYLPLGSIKDPNDPTWDLAEQAAEALSEDAGALRALEPPEPLT